MIIIPISRKDGYGAQFQDIITCIIFAELNGYEFVHRPITRMEHNYNNDSEFLNRINKSMNIDNKYRRNNQIGENEKYISDKNIKHYFDRNFEKYYNSKSLKNIRKNYLANKKNKSFYFPKDTVNITVHIRRNNEHDHGKVENMDKEYINLMKKINKKYNGECHFYIESQGDLDDFKDFFIFKNITFNLNGFPEISFYRMVISDILVITKSSFSYTAALLSTGEIYCKEFWHTCGKNWIKF